MSKSKDLREAAVKYRLKGNTLEKTSKTFGIWITTISRWVKKYKETGNLSNKPLNRKFKKIDPEKLKEYIRERPDATQKEMAAKFNCVPSAIHKALKRNGITRKKR